MLRKLISKFCIDWTDIGQREAHWDKEYEAGNWACLWAHSSLARLGMTAGYISSVARSRGSALKILEVGCGPGALRFLLNDNIVEAYFGIDISTIGINEANSIGFHKSSFVAADISSYGALSPESFDVVVMNDVINYLPDPGIIIGKLVDALAPGGYFCVCMWNSPNCTRAWSYVEQEIRLNVEWVCETRRLPPKKFIEQIFWPRGERQIIFTKSRT